MKKFVLGADGGATKSHIAIFDEKGDCVGSSIYGALNHETMKGSYAELEKRLEELLPHIVKNAGATIDDIAFAVFGLAGVDTDAQEALISGMTRKIGFKNQVMCNDAFLGVPAGCPDCVGICAINGTGFKLAAIDHSGVAVQTCGLGSMTVDRGGGRWYGFRAVGAVYNELYKLGKPTVMKDMMYEMLGISRREDYLEVFTEKFYGGNIDSIALNSVAFNAAAMGDEAAIEILEDSAIEYAGAIARLIMDLDFPVEKTVHVTLAGSVFVKQKVKLLQDYIEKRVADALNEHNHKGYTVEYTRLDAPPVAGAVMWAAQKAGFNIEMKSIKAGLAAAGL